MLVAIQQKGVKTMTLGVSVNNAVSSAALRDTNGSKLSREASGNTRTDEAAGRRAAKLADVEQAEAKASQVTKEVLNIKGAAEEAAESFRRIDIYA